MPTQTIHTSTLVGLLRSRSYAQPAQHAYAFLSQGDAGETRWTYAELDRRARAIAALLIQQGAAEQPVLLLHPPGLEYVAAFFGCLYARAIAVPAYPPRSPRSIPRIQAIIGDTHASIVLTDAESLHKLQRFFVQAGEKRDLTWIATDTVPNILADEWQQPVVDGETLAFLQYTSGSTATPKGVMVTHGNLLSNLHACHHLVQLQANGHMVSWLPPYHDMGLIGGILYPLYEGSPATLMSPMTFLQRPLRWLEAISRCQATISVAPNFAYELCARKITPEQRATLDLSRWDTAVCGAEPVRYETVQRFVDAFGPCGFRHEAFLPSYGLAESTLIVSCSKKGKAPLTRSFQQRALEKHHVRVDDTPETPKFLGNDMLPTEQTILIVDPETHALCPPDQVGEIWLAGPSVARGYWNKPAETASTFQARPVGSEENSYLRTGDLGFFYDDALFITGRLKDMIILQGHNYYPQDIEATVERCHPAIRQGCCVAFSEDTSGHEQMVVLVEIDPRYQPGKEGTSQGNRKTLDGAELLKTMRQALAEEHMVQAQTIMLVKAGSVLKTSSGKLQRRASRAAFLAGDLSAWGE